MRLRRVSVLMVLFLTAWSLAVADNCESRTQRVVLNLAG